MHREKDLPELMAEKDSLDPSFVHAMRLLAEGRATTATLFIGFIMRASLVCVMFVQRVSITLQLQPRPRHCSRFLAESGAPVGFCP